MVKVLIIYTGGTIGMVHDPVTNTLKPFDFEQVTAQVPELSRFDYSLSAHSFSPLIDSSNMQPEIWVELAAVISDNYDRFDGFVVLHGTDTMAYTASALSFMLENLGKPVVITGSQLPIGEIRTDAKENLITAIEIASAQENGVPLVKEVCIFFDYRLFRGNRSSKVSSSKFEAFDSPNYPPLAEAGVHIQYSRHLLYSPAGQFRANKRLDKNVGLLKLFPGLNQELLQGILHVKGLKALVLETFGAGNAPTNDWFIGCLQDAIGRGIVIYNVTQCGAGSVEQGRYETSVRLKDIGVVSGHDITTEAAITKLMFLLGQAPSPESLRKSLEESLRGEITK